MTTGENAMTGEAGDRYAKALFELADEAKALDATEKDMTALGEAFAESAELRAAAASQRMASALRRSGRTSTGT